MTDAASTLIPRFLLLCLRARFEPAALEAAREIAAQPGFDWDKAFAVAREEVVTPVLYDVLQNQPDVPAHVRQALRSAYGYTRRRNRFVLDEMKTVQAALRASGVRALVLNAAALAAYGDIGLRQLRDVDLLIGPDDRARLVGAVQPLGYAPVNAAVRDGEVIAYEAALALRKSDIVEVVMEAHDLALDSASAPFNEWLWANAKTNEGGESLSLEARFIYSCAAASLRHPGRLLWLHDVAEFLQRAAQSMNWEMVVERVREFGLGGPVQAAAAGLVEGWGAPIPPAAQEALRALAPQVANGRGDGPGQRSQAQPQAFDQLAARAFPPVDYMVRKYRIAHPGLAFLYYPVRWLDVLKRRLRP